MNSNNGVSIKQSGRWAAGGRRREAGAGGAIKNRARLQTLLHILQVWRLVKEPDTLQHISHAKWPIATEVECHTPQALSHTNTEMAGKAARYRYRYCARFRCNCRYRYFASRQGSQWEYANEVARVKHTIISCAFASLMLRCIRLPIARQEQGTGAGAGAKAR